MLVATALLPITDTAAGLGSPLNQARGTTGAIGLDATGVLRAENVTLGNAMA